MFLSKSAFNAKFISSRIRQFSTATRELNVHFREPHLEGSQQSRKLRADDLVPGIILGKSGGRLPIRKAISLLKKDVVNIWRKLGRSLENTLFKVHVDDGTSYTALPRQLQLHQVSEMPLSLNFVIYVPGSEIRIPIRFINEEDSVEIKRGAFIVPVSRYLPVYVAEGALIPQFIDIDASDIKKFQVFTIKDIVLPEGVTIARSLKPNFVAGTVKTASV